MWSSKLFSIMLNVMMYNGHHETAIVIMWQMLCDVTRLSGTVTKQSLNMNCDVTNT